MMEQSSNIKVISGNMFNSKAQTIVNTINCVGVMGKGIALVYKLRYPKMFEMYKSFCKQGLISIGKLWIYNSEPKTPWVLNVPTKQHWKFPSEMSYITLGLQKFVDTYKEKGITSIAFPLLGTHNGGLKKEDVLPVMIAYLSKCDIPIEIYEYNPNSPDDLFQLFKEKWNSIPMALKKETTGIRTMKQIETLDQVINSGNVSSMISLIESPGIGLKTMECCFQVVMNHNKVQLLFN